MNKTIVFISIIAAVALVNLGAISKTQLNELRDENKRLYTRNLEMKLKIGKKEGLIKHRPVLLSEEYGLVIGRVRMLESYTGSSMNVELESVKDTNDISEHVVGTEYVGVKGLKIKIMVDKFSKEADTGAVLDGIYLLEQNTDFMASEIRRDNNNLIVKGEIYGI